MDKAKKFLTELQQLSDKYKIYVNLHNYDCLSLLDENEKFIDEIYMYKNKYKLHDLL